MNALKVGWLLGLRQIQRASWWTTGLIISVMTLTFLNLVAISGILVGIVDGAVRSAYEYSLGDIIISPLDTENRILQTPSLIRTLETYPEIKKYSVRHSTNALVEANFRERRNLRGERDIVMANIVGIDPVLEDNMVSLSEFVVEGEYISDTEDGQILLGAYFVDRYAEQFGDIFDSLSDIVPGDIVRIGSGERAREFTVKGIVKSKRDEVSLSIYMPEREFRRTFGRLDHDANLIVVRTQPNTNRVELRDALKASGLDRQAKIQTFEDALPKFLTDIRDTFNILGLLVGSIGIVVASISIFIIIFINALSRRRHIGILKAIGIDPRAIEIAYVIQASGYALVGSFLGALIIYLFLVPYFNANPIDFPFSDGVLLAEPLGTFIRFAVLFLVTLVAGFLPAWMIVRQNTLSAILGRK